MLTLVLTQTAITKYNRLGALNNKKISLTVLDAVSTNSRCYQGLLSDESSLLRVADSYLLPSVLTSPFFGAFG